MESHFRAIKGKVAVAFTAKQGMERHGTARSSASISTAKGRSFEYKSIRQFCGKRAAPVFSYNLFIPFLPA